MLGFLCRRRPSQLRWAWSWVGDYSSRFSFIQISSSSLRFNYSSSPNNEPSPTVDYLINSCGFSPESALKTSKYIALKSTAKADSVLALFKSYGFTQHQISHIIASNPDVLRVDPNKIPKPKIELLCNIGISGPNLAKILSRYSNFLTVSLERQLIPALEFLRSFVHTDERLAITLSRLRWTIRLPELMTPNIEILRDHGVAESKISWLMSRQPRLLITKAEWFKELVLRTKEMGLDPSSSNFLYGLRVLSGIKKPTWEAKLAVFTNFGWLEDEILSLFRKQPSIFALSENKIRAGLDLLMNKLNWTIAYISTYPVTLHYSVEKRIFPRFSVFQVLLVKGLMKNESIGSAMGLTEDKFLNKYVLKYIDEQPHLLKLYQSKMGTTPSAEVVSKEKEPKKWR